MGALTETWWCIYAPVVHKAIIGSDDGLSPVWHQANSWTHTTLLLIGQEQILMKWEWKYNNLYASKLI